MVNYPGPAQSNFVDVTNATITPNHHHHNKCYWTKTPFSFVHTKLQQITATVLQTRQCKVEFVLNANLGGWYGESQMKKPRLCSWIMSPFFSWASSGSPSIFVSDYITQPSIFPVNKSPSTLNFLCSPRLGLRSSTCTCDVSEYLIRADSNLWLVWRSWDGARKKHKTTE